MTRGRSRFVPRLKRAFTAWWLWLLSGCGAWVQVPIPALPRVPLRCDEVEVLLRDGQRLRLERATISPPDLNGEVVWVQRPTTRTELGLTRSNDWHGELSIVDELFIRTTVYSQKTALTREDQALACWKIQ